MDFKVVDGFRGLIREKAKLMTSPDSMVMTAISLPFLGHVQLISYLFAVILGLQGSYLPERPRSL